MILSIFYGCGYFLQKRFLLAGVSAVFYDSLLVLGDEVQYMWSGRKSWTFYLYILNRVILVAYQSWNLYYSMMISNTDLTLSRSGHTFLANMYIQTFSAAFFVVSSDVFIILRTYAVSRSKIFACYLVILSFTRLDSWIETASVSTGTVFEISAFAVIIWYVCRSKSTLEYSALARTIVTEATIYFLFIVAVQIYLQVSFILLMEPTPGEPLPLSPANMYGFINSILTLRFALALKKSTDPEGVQEWQLTHFTTLEFSRSTSAKTDVGDLAARESIEFDLSEAQPRGEISMCWPQCSAPKAGVKDVEG